MGKKTGKEKGDEQDTGCGVNMNKENGSEIWKTLKQRMRRLQRALARVHPDRVAEDEAFPLFDLVQRPEFAGNPWILRLSDSVPLAFHREDIRDVVVEIDGDFADSLSVRELNATHDPSKEVPRIRVGADLAPLMPINGQDYTILIERDQGASHAGQYNFPAGTVTEKPSLTLIRELNQEVRVFIKQPDSGLRILLPTFNRRRGITAQKMNESMPRVYGRLYRERPDLEGRRVTTCKIPLLSEPRGSPDFQDVLFMDDSGRVADRLHGFVNDKTAERPSLGVIVPVRLVWKRASLNVTRPEQIIAIDAEDMVLHGGAQEGRKVLIKPVKDLPDLARRNLLLSNVAFASAKWHNLAK